MTDGARPGAPALGDPGFLQHDGIDQSLADSWRRVRRTRALTFPARQLAAELRYALADEAPNVIPCL
jgi:hypothetical protein